MLLDKTITKQWLLRHMDLPVGAFVPDSIMHAIMDLMERAAEHAAEKAIREFTGLDAKKNRSQT